VIPTSIKSLSQFFAMTDDNTNIINAIVANAKKIKRKLQTLYYKDYYFVIWTLWLAISLECITEKV
jgi:uncharacterized membrane protein